jgi:hypothetical protein
MMINNIRKGRQVIKQLFVFQEAITINLKYRGITAQQGLQVGV